MLQTLRGTRMAIQIIDENRYRGLSQELAGGLAKGLPDAIQQFQDYRNMQSENSKINSLIGLDLNDVRDPNTRKDLIADQLKFGRSMKQQKASLNLDIDQPSKEDKRSRRQQEIDDLRSENKRQPLREFPNFANSNPAALDEQSKKFFPNNVGGNDPTGQKPQTETTGKKDDRLTLNQRNAEAKRRLDQKTQERIETSLENEINNVNDDEVFKSSYNSDVDAELSNRVTFQTRYGNIADNFINGLPDSDPIKSPKIRAIIKGNAEKFAGKDTSEGAIQQAIAKDIENISNKFSQFEDAIPTANVGAKLGRILLNTDRGQKSFDDMRVKVDPLLKMGLYDEVRVKLAAKDYRTETIESILGDLGETTTKNIANMPNLSRATKPWCDRSPQEMTDRNLLSGEKLQQFQQNLSQTLQEDPTSNLILLRKAYGEKGVDWEDFWESLKPLIKNGSLKLTDDQEKQLNDLSQPPLDGLDKLFKSLGLVETL